ncbi:hypothetical protein FRC04_009664 [Tulasnella sp. 424]|nr:hypothetical protein FRC04_009664 [Tulasnella sp. 424]KAG8975963.1 hypothetical protein FRC05_004894 [Tulasnella sp. 425]
MSVKLVIALASLVPAVLGGGIVSDPSVFASKPFDYIVVGGGTAGLAVAARLSENPLNVVGVIEAGQHLPDDPLIFTPGLFGYAQGQPQYDWMLETVPQPALDGRVVERPRGKILGGSSALNYMAFDRGSKAEYDAWKQFGGADWSWDGLLPYFKKAEHVHGAAVTTPWNDPKIVDILAEGVLGPVQVSYNDWYSDITKPYLDTVSSLGIQRSTTPDNGDATGVYNCKMSVDRTTGRRSYAANTYHSIASARFNYYVLLGAGATKVVTTGSSLKRDDAAVADTADNVARSSGLTATGVISNVGSSTYTAKVKKEVIVSAGSLKTPQLLELSGIGNKTILQQYGITPVVDLPGVGENLQDHVFVPNSFALKPGYTTFDILANDPTYAAQQNATYYKNGTGMYAATHSAFAFFNLQTFMSQSDVNSLVSQAVSNSQNEGLSELEKDELLILANDAKSSGLGQVEIIMYPGHFSPSPAVPGTSYISILMALQRPWSRGSVHIGSSDATAPPVINPHYLENSFDLQVLIKACQFARKIAQTEPLKSAIASFQDPPSNVTSDADFAAYVKAAVEPVYHPVGTASLGARADGGVVDSRLKVYGTNNIRVADASIIPLEPASHLQSTVYAIGEKAADIILADNFIL